MPTRHVSIIDVLSSQNNFITVSPVKYAIESMNIGTINAIQLNNPVLNLKSGIHTEVPITAHKINNILVYLLFITLYLNLSYFISFISFSDKIKLLLVYLFQLHSLK